MKREGRKKDMTPFDWQKALNYLEAADITLRLPAAAVDPDTVAHRISTFLEGIQFMDAKQLSELEIAMVEALINAVDYGCLALKQSEKAPDLTSPSVYHQKRTERLADPQWSGREIRIRIVLDPLKVTIKIQDPGPGIPATIAKPKEILPYGRGIPLMRELVDRLTIKRNPSVLTLVKHRG